MGAYLFYTPENLDRNILPHDPFKAIVAPRPIGWVSTLSADGVANLAPYSFFNAVGGMPPMVIFSSEGYKDSANHAAATGEFVCNYVSRNLEKQMNETSTPAPAGISEFDHCGIERGTCQIVSPPRVAAAYAALECKVTDVVERQNIDGKKTGAVVIFGQVVGIHIDDAVIRDGRFDVSLANPVMRLGYLDFGYTEGLHELVRPTWDNK